MVDTIKIIDEPVELVVYQGGDYTVISYGGDDGDEFGNGLRFIGLIDTPDSYEGQAGKSPVVNEDETGLEFVSIVATKFTSLSDCPPSYKGNKNKLVQVNSDETGLQFVNVNTDINVIPFIQLADVPSSYEGSSEYVVTVAEGENGLVFTPRTSILPEIITAQTISNPIISVNTQGLVTAIREGAKTSLPDFPALSMLYGDGTNIPTYTNVGSTNQIPIVDGVTSTIKMQYLSSLRSTIGGLIVQANAATANQNSLLVNTSSNDVSLIAQNESNLVTNLVLGSNNGFVDLGSTSTTSVRLKSRLDVTASFITSDNYLWLKPGGTGTLRIDTSGLVNTNYAQSVTNANDIPNKEYVDKAIEEAISGAGGKSINVTVPLEVTALQPITSLGKIVAGSVIDELRIAVTTEFNAEDRLTIGTDIDNALLCDIKIKETGVILIPTYYTISADTEFKVYINGTATQGKAVIYIKYI